MRDYVNETCRNLEFDYMMLKYVQEYQDRNKTLKPKKPENTFRNGLIYQYVLVFKTLCTLPDNSMSSKDIRDRYHKFFGASVNQPSCARALYALDKIGLVKFTPNPFDKQYSSTTDDSKESADAVDNDEGDDALSYFEKLANEG